MSKRLLTRVPELLKQRGWDTRTFIAYGMLSGLSSDTVRRMEQGETNFTTETLAKAVELFGVESIAEIVDVAAEEQ